MIESISFSKLKSSPLFGFAAGLEFFKGRRELKFKPGLNVLFGSNGSGKSTVLKMLGQSLCATQSGQSCFTREALESTTVFKLSGPQKDAIGLPIAHDGQPVLYCDPRHAVGLTASGRVDQEFAAAGMSELADRQKLSHGQVAVRQVNRILSVLSGDTPKPTKVGSITGLSGWNDVWQRKLAVVQERMQPRIEKGPLTVLLDEPETHFNFAWQEQIWAALIDTASRSDFQLIVATHSPFCLGIAGANYIEFDPGAVGAAELSLKRHVSNMA